MDTAPLAIHFVSWSDQCRAFLHDHGFSVLEPGSHKRRQHRLAGVSRFSTLPALSGLFINGSAAWRGVTFYDSGRRFPTFASFRRSLPDWLLFTMFGNPALNAVQGTWIMVAGVTWSLRYEWLFYLALPLLALAARRNRPSLAALLSTLAIAVFVLRPHSKFAIGMMQAFVGGIIATYWVRNPALVRFSQRTVSGLAAIAGLAAVVMLSPTG